MLLLSASLIYMKEILETYLLYGTEGVREKKILKAANMIYHVFGCWNGQKWDGNIHLRCAGSSCPLKTKGQGRPLRLIMHIVLMSRRNKVAGRPTIMAHTK